MRPAPDLHVERGLLVRVLAVRQVEELLVRHHPVLGEFLVPDAEPAADRRVVAGGEGERLVRQPVASRAGDAAPGLLELGQHRVVALRLHHHDDERWFLAAALIIVGPPMSMFSIASASLTACLATVRSNG